MFELEHLHWDAYKLCRVWHQASDSGLLLAPARGGCLLRLQLHGWDFLCGYQEAAELDSLDWARSGWLFPFPNRLRDGRYSWQGNSYSFPINDVATGNAIHGFLQKEPMRLSSIRLGHDFAEVELGCSYKGQHPGYPFPMELSLLYTLHLDGRFEVRMQVENRGRTKVPFGWGWHPYFRVGEPPVDAWNLRIPAAEVAVVDERMLPTGQMKPLDYGPELSPIKDRVFDHCLHLLNSNQPLELVGERARIRWQQTNAPYLQLFTPPMRDSLAIEPMSCGVDALNTSAGLILLDPSGQEEFGVALQLDVLM